ncbi:hypothetical protein L6452_29885 [Arctium lappa]|uniref:Uncharacterized protein n=1 Tax=Arctium lappa TaxID=4217 RepID=A0ACB8ZHT3_ARCLA|nr:hypothetical protein L6452_29885 [Arctium lappa]
MFSTKPSQSPAPRHLLQLLQLSINNQSFKLTQQSHARIYHLGLQQHPVVLTNLINAYALSKNPVQSRKLFDSIEVKDICLWNSYINGFVKNDLHYESFSVFNNMCRTANSFPDGFTFSTLSKASGVIGDLLAGKCVHGKSIKLGFMSDTILTNSLMSMYYKCDRIHESRKLFDEMPQRTVSSWNIILSGYVNGENPFLEYQVWEFVKYMLTEGLKPNEFTLSSLLPLCGFRLGRFDHGMELHCYIIRNELNLVIDSGWDSVAEVRKTMKERSLRKFPGCSWITVNSETHSFSVSDKGHPDSGKIHEILNELILAMKDPDLEILIC